jgi:hypothetical protein
MRAICRALGLLAVAVLAGCASIAPAPEAAPKSLAERCERALAAIDEAVVRAGVRDVEASHLAGFPYLRSNRFLASFRDAPLDETQYREWVDAMTRLDREGRLVEIANLPPAETRVALAALRAEGFADLPPAGLLEGCGTALRDRDLADAGARERVRSAAVVPDDYDTWKRIVGLYAVTRVPFAAGVRRWHEETLAVFGVPLDRQPAAGALSRYTLADTQGWSRSDAARAIARSREGSALGVHDARALRELAAAYAPVFEVDEISAADRVGRPAFDATGRPTVDVSMPVIFVRVAHTRYRGEILPQLVYTIWFPERPQAGTFDMLSGRMDAVVWRVTLASDGEPVLFDTMHACGCYHLFFPTPRATLRAAPDSLDEYAFVPATLPRLAAGERVLVRIAPGTHYVSAVSVSRGAPQGTRLLNASDEDSLRRLPLAPGATRSLYGPDGIVPGTERGERYLFWPMGVPDPGAMRQWGRHATAFVGRRHFDEADLVERYFTLGPASP